MVLKCNRDHKAQAWSRSLSGWITTPRVLGKLSAPCPAQSDPLGMLDQYEPELSEAAEMLHPCPPRAHTGYQRSGSLAWRGEKGRQGSARHSSAGFDSDSYAPLQVVTAGYRDPRSSNDPTVLSVSACHLLDDTATPFSYPSPCCPAQGCTVMESPGLFTE